MLNVLLEFKHTEDGPLIALGCEGRLIGFTAIVFEEFRDPQLLEREQLTFPVDAPTVTTHV
jgi:predicted ester cyclase